MACRTFIPDGQAEIWRAIYYLQKSPWENYRAIAFLKRHLENFHAPAPTDRKLEFQREIERAAAKSGIGDATSAVHNERVYRQHNVTRTHRKSDAAGIAVIGRPNEPDQQCQCDPCRHHRKANARTGVARPGREI